MSIKVNDPSEEVGELYADFQLVSDLMGGTKAMRRAGATYLPRRTLEEQQDHLARLKSSTLYPAFKETIVKMTGRVFQEEMLVHDDGTDGINWIVGSEEEDDNSVELEDSICDDIDQQGRNIQIFARDVFKTGLAYGLTHVFVDSPPAVKKDGTPIVSMADQQASPEVRPYAIHIHPRRILGWIQSKDGKLIQLRMTGYRAVREEFGESRVDQVWVYDVVGTQVVRRDFEKQADGTWQPVDSLVMDIDHIPLVTFYTNRIGFMMAESPLLELAYLNVKHWQKQSDLDELMHVATVPILVQYGGNADSQIIIGRSAVKMPAKPDAELSYCEHSGKAIDAGWKDLEMLKQEMRDAGAKLLQPQSQSKAGSAQSSSKTATQVNEEAAADNSILGANVQDFEDFFDTVLSEFAAWRDQKSGGTVECQPNLDPDNSPIETITLLLQAATAGKYSDESLYEEMQKRGLVNPDRPWQDELQRIKSQPENQLPPPKAPVPGVDPSKQMPPKGAQGNE